MLNESGKQSIRVEEGRDSNILLQGSYRGEISTLAASSNESAMIYSNTQQILPKQIKSRNG